MNRPHVLVFDSGVGGFSVAECIHRRIPAAVLTCLADNAGFPYGNLAEATVVARTLALVAREHGAHPADVIVVACNTASTVVLPALRAEVNVPVVGVVPAVKPAAALSVSRRIGVLATPATVRRPYLDQLIREFARDCQVQRLGHPRLVHWIEDWVRGLPLPRARLSAALQPFRDAGVDTVVLGCTHYPLIRPLLQELLPEVKHWVDSGDAIARRTAALLSTAGFDPDRAPAAGAGSNSVVFSGAIPPGIEGFIAGLGLGRRSHLRVSDSLALGLPAQ